MISHDKIFCHEKFRGTCSSVELPRIAEGVKGYMVRERLRTPVLGDTYRKY